MKKHLFACAMWALSFSPFGCNREPPPEFPPDTSSQPQSLEQIDDDPRMKELVAKHAATIRNVVAQLREVSDDKQVFDQILAEGGLIVPSIFDVARDRSRPLDPNATADRNGSAAHVRVDDAMMYALYGVADAGARDLATELGGPSATLDTVALETLSYKISDAALAWLLAHEACHHVWHHPEATDLGQARHQELEADRCAFDHSLRAGYSLTLQRQAFRQWAKVEDVRIQRGLEVAEELRDHPYFRTRLIDLETALNRSTPSREGWIIFGGFFPRQGKVSYRMLARRAEPARHDGFLVELGSEPQAELTPSELSGRGAIMYALPPARARFDIAALDRQQTTLAVQELGQVVNVLVFRDGFRFTEGAQDEKVARAMRFDIHAAQLAAVTRVAPEVADQCRSVLELGHGEQQGLLLRYGRGELGASEWQALRMTAASRMEARLADLLGPQGHARYQALLQKEMSALVKDTPFQRE